MSLDGSWSIINIDKRASSQQQKEQRRLAVPNQLIPYSFPKGVSGNPGGRGKNFVRAVLAEEKIDVVRKVLELIPQVSLSEQLEAWFILLSYMQGKPKDVDEPPPENGLSTMSNEDLAKLAAERFPHLLQLKVAP